MGGIYPVPRNGLYQDSGCLLPCGYLLWWPLPLWIVESSIKGGGRERDAYWKESSYTAFKPLLKGVFSLHEVNVIPIVIRIFLFQLLSQSHRAHSPRKPQLMHVRQSDTIPIFCLWWNISRAASTLIIQTDWIPRCFATFSKAWRRRSLLWRGGGSLKLTRISALKLRMTTHYLFDRYFLLPGIVLETTSHQGKLMPAPSPKILPCSQGHHHLTPRMFGARWNTNLKAAKN